MILKIKKEEDMKDLLTKNHPMSPNGQDSISKNNSYNLSLINLILLLIQIDRKKIKRKNFIK